MFLKLLEKILIKTFFLFLFFFPISTFAGTLYYTPLFDTDWNTVGNWFQDPGFTVFFPGVPTDGDTVFIAGELTSGPLNSPIMNHIYVAHPDTGGGSFGVLLGTAVGNTTFYDASINEGSVTGVATFNNNSINNGLVSTDATFNNNSSNSATGTVSGDAIFTDDAVNQGIISGTATFSVNAYSAEFSQVHFSALFYDSSYSQGAISGNSTFYDNSILGDSGAVGGDATFYDNSYSNGTVEGNAYFYDSSLNFQGTIQGNAEFWETTTNDTLATVNGDACFAPTATNNGTVLGAVSVCSSDSTAPSVTNRLVSNITTNSAQISWTTSEDATSTISYGTTVSVGTIATSTENTSHVVTLSNLNSATRYYYQISAHDLANNSTSTSVYFFDTKSENRSGSKEHNDSSVKNKQKQEVDQIPAASPLFVFTKTLKLMDRDFEVKKLQQYLNKKGFQIALNGPGSLGNETEYFGLLTFNALKKFQASVGINSTGFFGNITKAYANSHQ